METNNVNKNLIIKITISIITVAIAAHSYFEGFSFFNCVITTMPYNMHDIEELTRSNCDSLYKISPKCRVTKGEQNEWLVSYFLRNATGDAISLESLIIKDYKKDNCFLRSCYAKNLSDDGHSITESMIFNNKAGSQNVSINDVPTLNSKDDFLQINLHWDEQPEINNSSISFATESYYNINTIDELLDSLYYYQFIKIVGKEYGILIFLSAISITLNFFPNFPYTILYILTGKIRLKLLKHGET